MVYSLGSKGKLLFLVERASAPMLKHIRQDFSEYVVIVTRRGRWMNGSIHCHEVLPQVIKDFSDKLRINHPFLNKDGEPAHHVYLEDSAGSHLGDYCKATKEADLIEQRAKFFRGNHMTRVPIYGCGTPERAPPDQQFRVLKLAVY